MICLAKVCNAQKIYKKSRQHIARIIASRSILKNTSCIFRHKMDLAKYRSDFGVFFHTRIRSAKTTMLEQQIFFDTIDIYTLFQKSIFWCFCESKSGFLAFRNYQKTIIRVTYFLQILVGRILQISKIQSKFCQNVLFEQKLDF